MTEVIWEPDARKPPDAADLDGQIDKVAPGARVKITLLGDTWLVRALAPAALCTRGPGVSGRDVSDAVAEVLRDSGYPASSRRPR